MKQSGRPKIVARCVVCRGDTTRTRATKYGKKVTTARHHSLPYPRARALEYSALVKEQEGREQGLAASGMG